MADVVDIVRKVADQYGVPEWVWRPIMEMESGGNPGAHNPNGEDSRGLFQINVKANPQWVGVDLYDPEKNAKIAFEHFIAPAWEQVENRTDMSAGDKAAYVWKEGIRPKWTEEKNQAIRAKAYGYLGTGTAGVGNKVGDWVRGLLGFTAPNPMRSEIGSGSSTSSPAPSSDPDRITILKDSWLTPGLSVSAESIKNGAVTVLLLALGILALYMFLRTISAAPAVVVTKGAATA